MKLDKEQIRQLHQETGVAVITIHKLLKQNAGNLVQTRTQLASITQAKVTALSQHNLGYKRIFSYLHPNGKYGAMLILACETDFAGNTDVFTTLGNELAMQAAALQCRNSNNLTTAVDLRTGHQLSERIAQAQSQLGEQIQIVDLTTCAV